MEKKESKGVRFKERERQRGKSKLYILYIYIYIKRESRTIYSPRIVSSVPVFASDNYHRYDEKHVLQCKISVPQSSL